MDSSKFHQMVPFKSSALWKGVGLGAAICLLVLAIVVPYLLRSRMAANEAGGDYRLAALSRGVVGGEAESVDDSYVQADGPKIVYKAEIELLVGNCAETLKKIQAQAASEAGFVQ